MQENKGRYPHNATAEKPVFLNGAEPINFFRKICGRILLLLLLMLCHCILPVCAVYAAEATFTWTANTEPNLAGYKIHYGTVSGTYTAMVEVPKSETTWTITGLSSGVTYYFAATAYDVDGNESGYSNEVAWSTPAPPDNTVYTAATFSWTANTEPNLAGYRIYYGTSSRTYSQVVEIPKSETTKSITGLSQDVTYYFAATAYDVDGNESDYSQEVVWSEASVEPVPVNNPPVASSSTVQTAEDNAVTGLLSATDPENDPLIFSLVSNGSLGTAVLTDAGTGAFTYTPYSNKNGTDGFTFRVSDGTADSAVATVTIAIASINDQPMAHALSTVTNEDEVLSDVVTGYDIENSPLTFSLVSNASHGSVAIQPAGAFTYTPSLDFNGNDSFSFVAHDGTVNSDPATVFITVTPINDLPVAENLSISTDKNTPVIDMLPATDPENDPLVYSLVNQGSLGSVEITDSSSGSFNYSPFEQKSGMDSFTFKVSDGTGESEIATVQVDIRGEAVATFSWTANTEPSLAGYRIYYGTTSRSYLQMVDVPKSETTKTVSGLSQDVTYYFAATAYDADGNESDYSNEVVWSEASVEPIPVNNPPVASNSTVQTSEDHAVTGLLSATDPESDPLTYSLVSNGALGVAVLTDAGTGAFIYTPDSNKNGTDSFTFRVSDGKADSGMATVTIAIESVNDLPVAHAGSGVTSEDAVLNGTVTGIDVESPLTFSLVSNASHGSVALQLSGAFVYTPEPNFNGMDSFTFLANDGTVNSAPASVAITVNAINDPPVAASLSMETPEENEVAGLLSATDPESDPLVYSLISNGSLGLAVLTDPGTGAFTYTPSSNNNGTDSFTFKVNDGKVDSAPATVSINVTAINDVPEAHGATGIINEDEVLTGIVTGSDIENSPLTFSLASNASHGSVVLQPTGAFAYTPEPNFNGNDSFTFLVNDGTVNSAPASVAITVNAVNDPPVAANISMETPEDNEVAGLLSATDPENDTLVYSLVGNGSLGLAVLTDAGTGAFTYTPSSNKNGTDTFTFRVNDGKADSAPGTVSINVTGINDVPEAHGATGTTNEDEVLNGVVTGSDIENSPLTFSLANNASHGSVVLQPTGAFAYTPEPNFNGNDSFTFLVNDGTVNSLPASISITVNAVNDPPVAANISMETPEENEVAGLLSATDPENDSLVYSLVSNGSLGLAVLRDSGTGAFTYTPFTNKNGTDSFTFRVNDGKVDSAPGTVSINVTGINDVPEAHSGEGTTNEDEVLNSVVTGTDVENSPLTFSLANNASHGSVVLQPTGAFTYTPEPNFNGNDSFTFLVNDGTVNSAPASVAITVSPTNDIPVAHDTKVVTDEDEELNGVVTGSDIENSPLIFSLATNVSHGVVVLQPAGSFTYTPEENFNGTDSFTFLVNDGISDSAPATVAITVNAINDVPLAHSGTSITDEDEELNDVVTGSDIENSPLTFSLVNNASHGFVVLRSTGSFTYTPAPNFNGTDSFTFLVNDGTVNSTFADMDITVTAINDPPIAENLSISTDKNIPLTGILSATDIENDLLTYSLVSSGSLGSAQITNSSTGVFRYTPFDMASGMDSFVFKASDGAGESLGTVKVDIGAGNEPPVALILTQEFVESPLMMGFDGSSSYDPDGRIESYLWNFGDGTTATDSSLNHVYSIAGEYSVPLMVVDDQGADAQDVVTITVAEKNDNIAPVSHYTATAFVEDLSTFKFSGVSSEDSDGEIIDYSWNFGDGETGSGVMVLHQYLSPGIYSATLTVTDNDGGTSKKVSEIEVSTVEGEMLHLEVGEIAAAGDWQRVVFAEPFTAPVIVANPASYTDSDPGVIRINNLQANGFDIRFQNWKYLGIEHAEESISYIVMEAGNYALSDGSRIEAGSFATELTENFKQIHFAQPFAIDPVVITSIVSAEENDAVVGRIRNVKTTSFEYKMQEQESNIHAHSTEKVCYLAWEPSQGSIANVFTYEVGKTGNTMTHDWNEILFNQIFTSLPVFIADMQTSNDLDPSALRYDDLRPYSVQLKIEEEESLDFDILHGAEEIGVILLEDLNTAVCTSGDYFVVKPQITALTSPSNGLVVFFDASESSCFEMVNCVKEERQCDLKWDFGGGTGRIIGGNDNDVIVYQYDSAGDYTAGLTMRESISGTVAVDSVDVKVQRVEEAPQSPIIFETFIDINTVALTISDPDLSDADVEKVTVFWGDRGRDVYVGALPVTLNHTYFRTGRDYAVRVKTVTTDGDEVDYIFIDDEKLLVRIP